MPGKSYSKRESLSDRNTPSSDYFSLFSTTFWMDRVFPDRCQASGGERAGRFAATTASPFGWHLSGTGTRGACTLRHPAPSGVPGTFSGTFNHLTAAVLQAWGASVEKLDALNAMRCYLVSSVDELLQKIHAPLR